MTCPACASNVPSGRERCPSCGVVVSPLVEGALAPNPGSLTPPARGGAEPLRELPGMRRRERTWKDEVRDRVQHRRRQRGADDELPLFRDAEEPEHGLASDEAEDGSPYDAEGRPEMVELQRPDVEVDAADDLPLRPQDDLRPQPEPELDPRPELREPRLEHRSHGVGPELDEEEREARRDEWPLDLPDTVAQPDPVERPATPMERLQAATVDLGLLAGLFALVVYFASRAAHVTVSELRPSWPYLGSYLALLGLVYAVYFTGTTGQTLGKMLFSLRVVDGAGRPPGYVKALLRAALGSVGVAAALSGVAPILFDPARRGLHDRLLKTRVVAG